MAQLKGTNLSPSGDDDESPERARTVTYNMLIRQSKKLGHTATNALDGAKQFLKQDIPLPSADSIFSNFPRTSRSGDKKRTNVDDLKKIVKHSHEILADVQTVFPVTLFPDRLCLDRSVITITKRTFFWSSNTTSIRIEDVLNVSTGIGPIFGSLTISSRVIIQGYLIAKHSGIDTDHLSAEELVETLQELGTENGQ
jgi:hypothetical protein